MPIGVELNPLNCYPFRTDRQTDARPFARKFQRRRRAIEPAGLYFPLLSLRQPHMIAGPDVPRRGFRRVLKEVADCVADGNRLKVIDGNLRVDGQVFRD